MFNEWEAYRTEILHSRTTLYGLRHTFVSLTKNDVPAELIKLLVGHSSSMDTFGVYGHEIDGERDRAAALLDKVFATVTG